jgi:hypothetical protein
MTPPYTLFADLATEAPIPARVLGQTLSTEGVIEFLLFAFAVGEQLSEHTSARRRSSTFSKARANSP